MSKAYIIATEAIKDPSGMAEYAKAAEPAIATWRVLRSPAKALGPQRGAPHSEPVRSVRGWPIVIIALCDVQDRDRMYAYMHNRELARPGFPLRAGSGRHGDSGPPLRLSASKDGWRE